jgi:hypothetical protein
MSYVYKCVPVPTTITTGTVGKDAHGAAVSAYEDIINTNAVDGWELFSVDSIVSRQNPGCLGALMGKKGEEAVFKLLIYRKEK